MTTKFSEVEIGVLVEHYFTNNVAECPRCHHTLRVDEGRVIRPRVSLLFLCERCSMSGHFDRSEEQPDRQWTETECQRLMTEADAGSQLRCPYDNTLMWARDHRGNLGAPIQREIICRRCGNMHRFKLTARAEVDA